MSDRKVATGRTDIKTKLTEGRSNENRAKLVADLITKISNEVQGTGCQVYVAECLNGACNKVFVAGRTQDEAIKFLTLYDELQENAALDSGLRAKYPAALISIYITQLPGWGCE